MRAYKLIFLICLLSGWVISCKSPLGDSFTKQFVISDTLNIQSISISGESNFILKRVEKGWEMNNGSSVNQVAINNLLLALARLEKLGVSRNLMSDDSKSILFSVETQKKNYSFSCNFSENGAYIGKIDSDEVYRFGIKGFPEINMEDVFSGTESHWKDPLIINFSPDAIKKIEVVPAPDWGEAFQIVRKGSEWQLIDGNGKEVSDENINSEKLFDYCRNFIGIYFDEEIADKNLYENSHSKDVFYSIKIVTHGEKEMVFSICPYYNDMGEYDDFKAIITKSGSESVYLVNYVFLDPMFESYSSFLKK